MAYLLKDNKGYFRLFETVAGKTKYVKYIGKDPSAYYASLEKGAEIAAAIKRYPDLAIKGNGQAILSEYKRRLITTPPPITKIYNTVVIDPPWPMEKIVRDVTPITQQYDFEYATMSLDEIKRLPIDRITAENSHLYLWTTHKFLPDAFDILEYWQFKYIFTMVWHKNGGFQPFGLAQYNCEFVLFGRKGNLPFDSTKGFPTCFSANRRAHSQKPDGFYDIVRRVSPAERLDYFSRESRDGFDQFGAEANKLSG